MTSACLSARVHSLQQFGPASSLQQTKQLALSHSKFHHLPLSDAPHRARSLTRRLHISSSAASEATQPIPRVRSHASAGEETSPATSTVLVLGGSGRIGSSVAADLLSHTDADVIITGRTQEGGQDALQRLGKSSRVTFMQLDLANSESVGETLRNLQSDKRGLSMVVHCAGPFHHRDELILKSCIDLGIDYVDVSDYRGFTTKALKLSEEAEAAGVTAVINTGVFPGISNSMVKLGVENIDQPEKVQLSYVVAGSGGAGLTVMRTTFLGLQHSFQAWLDGRWQSVNPYTAREAVDFPPPYGRAYVYWFEMPETFTLKESFPVNSVVTKFGSIPDLYNHLTWMTANVFPKAVIRSSAVVEILSRVSKAMTDVTDVFSGVGVAMQAEVKGAKSGVYGRHLCTFTHPNTAVACGAGTGGVAQLILNGKLNCPGVNPVERVLSTELFLETMEERNIVLENQWVPAGARQTPAILKL